MTLPAVSCNPIVETRGIRKAFGAVEVLHGIDFEVLPGEVHVLAGENGAGKSTLIKILSGVYGDYTGQLNVQGKVRRLHSPKDAAAAGIVTIHQEASLVPSMSVADNLFLGREKTGRFGFVDFRRQEAESRGILAAVGIDISPRRLLSTLPVAARQLLEIGRALAVDAKLLILDEPTSALSEQETGVLFARIAELRRQERGVVYISHRMEEIYRLADRITVLRDGHLVGTARAGDLPPESLLEWMLGTVLRAGGGRRRTPAAETALRVEGLRVAHPEVPGSLTVDGVTFELRRGEILGLAGLQGSGTSEVLHAVFGALDRRVAGRMWLGDEELPIRNPASSIARGVMLLPNDRKSAGLVLDLSVLHNASLASLHRLTTRLGWVRRRGERQAVAELSREIRLRAQSLEAAVHTLSGGNQQKVVLAKCLLARPAVLLLDEPTRGVDVGARADIYGLMRRWVDEGISMMLVTSELEELLALSDRILVLHRGRISAEFTRQTATAEAILRAAMGSAAETTNGGPA